MTQLHVSDFSAILDTLAADLLVRSQDPPVRARLAIMWQDERDAGRTADPFDLWTEARATQVAAAWLLTLLFVRVLEDRDLLRQRRVAGPGAVDSEQLFGQLFPYLTSRDYLLAVLDELARAPGLGAVFDAAHNPAWTLTPSQEGAQALLRFFRQRDADGALLMRFDDLDPRFLGDLYQDLNASVRKRYALLQTPHFVEDFILNETLTPAIKRFGLTQVRVLDPTCGSGHFLLGAFHRLLDAYRSPDPSDEPPPDLPLDSQSLAAQALSQIFGVDINPYAVAIARFRLILAFIEAAKITNALRLPHDLPDNVINADSLFRYEKESIPGVLSFGDGDALRDPFEFEDPAAIQRLLKGQRYHVVVGNPPYITVKDKALRESYRAHYDSAHGKYSLSVPFIERFFQLADTADGPGFVGMINANAFMKREFGRPLIEEVLANKRDVAKVRFDLTKIVDTSGAYIPGHGTPTVMLFGRPQMPTTDELIGVLGKRGEPETPDDPAQGCVWSSIRDHHDELGYEDEFLSVDPMPRARLVTHPWSLEGGGAADLNAHIETQTSRKLNDTADSIGISCFTLEDEAFIADVSVFSTQGIEAALLRRMVVGEVIRDWSINICPVSIFPYNEDFKPHIEAQSMAFRFLWRFKACLSNNKLFGSKTKIDGGLKWFEYGRLTSHKLRTPLSIAFAYVATHNHFVLDRGGKVFKQTAPIIKLPANATEDEHLALLGYLNSSLACFWMKQIFFDKGSSSGGTISKKRAVGGFLGVYGHRNGAVPLACGRDATPSLEFRS